VQRFSPTLTLMIAAVRKAAKVLVRDFGEIENLQVSKKGTADFVTKADLKAEQVLFDELSKARPGYGFLMEERGVVEGSDKTHRFIVDPLDGTLNFMHGMPHFSISVALEREGAIVSGIVYDVIKNEMFVAEKGEGAWLNDEKRLRVAARTKLIESMIATGFPFAGKEGHDVFLREMADMMARTAGIRRQGSAALDLAYVAAGRYDGFWERNLKAWDMAAGLIIVREAGGFARDPDGQDCLETGNIVAGNETMARLIEARLRAVSKA
jgi:myo-inositol-1(or 4)-monophosphatase